MEMIAPEGPVYQAGTLSGNPLATTAGLAMLNLITENPGIYTSLAQRGLELKNALANDLKELGLNYWPCVRVVELFVFVNVLS